MKRKRFIEAQIVSAMQQAEAIHRPGIFWIRRLTLN
jgi:hypothetical protein